MTGFFDINGEVFSEKEAKISAFDRGFLLGDGVFEVFLVENGNFVFFENHLSRLFSSLDRLEFSSVVDRNIIKSRCLNLLSRAQFKRAYMRLMVTRGSGLGFQGLEEKFTPNLYIYIKELPQRRKSEIKLKLKICHLGFTIRRIKDKSNNYLESLVALKKAQKEGYQDVLWVNSSDEVTEASASNIFFIRKKKERVYIETPALESGILPGVTRKNLIKSLCEYGIEVTEKIIESKDLIKYDGCFLTSAIKQLVPVVSFDKKISFENDDFLQIEEIFLDYIRKQEKIGS